LAAERVLDIGASKLTRGKANRQTRAMSSNRENADRKGEEENNQEDK
jgi:hypothetical protein